MYIGGVVCDRHNVWWVCIIQSGWCWVCIIHRNMCVVFMILRVSFRMSVLLCVVSFRGSESFILCVCVLWAGVCITVAMYMHGGVVVGAQGDGGRRSSIPENGCGRWSLDLGARRIGDRV